MAKYSQLNPNALGTAVAAVSVVFWVFMLGSYGMGFHYGMMSYWGFYPMMGLWMLVLFVALGYATGWMIAKAYNYTNSRK